MFGLMFVSTHEAAVAKLRDHVSHLTSQYFGSESNVDRLRGEKTLAGKLASEALRERDEARNTLSEIAGMETAGANATVKRMAAKARSIAAKREAV